MMNMRIALLLALAACSSEAPQATPSKPRPDAPADTSAPPKTQAPINDPTSPGFEAELTAVGASQHPNLQWKRYRALEAELARGLELDPGELCNEFGGESCIRSVHLVALGGHEPFTSGMLEPSADPLGTTPGVVDRVMLSACGKRVELDRALGPGDAKLLGDLANDAPAPSPDDARIKLYITSLYQRLLARDPEAFELSAVGSLARNAQGEALPALEFATLACFAIASSAEFLFF